MKTRYVQFDTFIAGIWREQGFAIDMTDAQADVYKATGQLADQPAPQPQPEETPAPPAPEEDPVEEEETSGRRKRS